MIPNLIQEHLLKSQYDSFDDFLKAHSNPAFQSICQHSWNQFNLACICLDCSSDFDTCICLQCFLNSNHENHNVLFFSCCGNCDCGDSAFGSYFCSQHHGGERDPHISQLDSQTRDSVQKASHHLFSFISDDNASEICRILSSLASLGDGMRRCVVLGIQDQLESFIEKITLNSSDLNQEIFTFFGQLCNDDLFRTSLAQSCFSQLIGIIKCIRNLCESGRFLDKLHSFDSILFISFSHVCLSILLKKGIDIINISADFFVQSYSIIVDFGDSFQEIFIFPFPIYSNLSCFLDFLIRENMVSEQLRFCELIFKGVIQFEGKSKRFPENSDLRDLHLHTIIWATRIQYSQFRKFSQNDLTLLFSYFSSFLQSEYGNTSLLQLPSISSSPISYFLFLHCILSDLLFKHSDNMLVVLNKNSNENNFDPDHFLMLSIVSPLRFLLALLFSKVGLYSRSNIELTTELSFFLATHNYVNLPISLFFLIQLFVGLLQDKNLFLEYLFHFSELNECSDHVATKSIRLSILIFLLTLVLDRSVLLDNEETYISDIIKSSLYSEPIPSDEFLNTIPSYIKNGQKFDSILHKTACIFKDHDLYLFRLNQSSTLNIYSPYVSLANVFSFLNKHVQHSPNSFLTSPDFKPEPFSLTLAPLMTCKSTFYLLYIVLWSYHFDNSTKSDESIFVVFDYLKLIASIYSFSLSSSKFPVCDLNAFSFNSFSIAFQTPFHYRDSEPYSMLQLVEKIGELGCKVLISMKIQYVPPPPKPVSDSNQTKVQRLRSLILSQMGESQNQFLLEDDDMEDTYDCSICNSHHENALFCFPLLIVETNLGFFLDEIQTDKPVWAFSMCDHKFHINCLKNSSFQCPLCRNPFTHSLPILPLYSQPSSQIDQFNIFLDEFGDSLLDSFCSSIIIFDFRQRNKPTSIHDTAFSKMLSALYSLLWYFNQTSPIPSNSYVQTPFSKFIFQSLGSKNIFDDFEARVHQVGDSLDDAHLFVFLRRVLFFQHFVFNNVFPQDQSLMNWDTELTFNSLCSRFKFIFREIVSISQFPFISLPMNFIDFLRPPFSFPLAVQSLKLLVCLFDGALVKLLDDEEDVSPYPLLYDYLAHNYRECSFPIPFLILSGDDSTRILFVQQDQLRLCEPIYLDQFGTPNCGFNRKAKLTLSHDQITSFINFILTLKWFSVESNDIIIETE